MDIVSLQIQNCLTIGQAYLELDNRGLLLIQGVNNDDTSAISNGSGKSSIVDAIEWCLYGETAREVSGDLIVNETIGKDCFVKIHLDDAGVKYLVERFRKHAVNKNQLFVWQLDPGVGAIALHKGTEKETQIILTKILGCSLEVFDGAVYAGQEKMPDLPGMTDKHLKLVVEEAAGVEELAEAYVLAQKAANTAQGVVTAAFNRERTLEAEVASATIDAQQGDEQVKLFEDGRKDRARLELGKAAAHAASVTDLDQRIAALGGPAAAARIVVLEDALAGRVAEDVKLAHLVHAERVADKALASSRSFLDTAKRNVELAKQSLQNVEDQIGKNCRECGKEYCGHDMDAARAARTLDVANKNALLFGIATETKKVLTAQITAVEAVVDYRATMTDFSAALAELAVQRKVISDLQRVQAERTAAVSAIEAIKTAAKVKLTEANPWTQAAEDRNALLLKVKTFLADAKLASETSSAALELAQDAAKVFGPAGVRAHVLDTVTPFLNAQTGEYLGALADGNISATWSTLGKTAKGELTEKFNIAVSNDKGGKTFKGQSGGEKRKVRVATSLALQDMQASRASKPINLFMADEIDDALDAAGLERLMGVLDKKAKERGTVLVISHNALTDWIDSVITVTKTGGVSTVSGATVRGF